LKGKNYEYNFKPTHIREEKEADYTAHPDTDMSFV
jgi:hypothetical protein